MTSREPDGPPTPDDEIAAPSQEDDARAVTPERTAREGRLHERQSHREGRPAGMIPGRERRRTGIERSFMRLVATGGIVGIAVLLGAVLTSQDVAGWIVGLVIGLASVILAALLWSARQL